MLGARLSIRLSLLTTGCLKGYGYICRHKTKMKIIQFKSKRSNQDGIAMVAVLFAAATAVIIIALVGWRLGGSHKAQQADVPIGSINGDNGQVASGKSQSHAQFVDNSTR